MALDTLESYFSICMADAYFLSSYFLGILNLMPPK